MHFYEAKHLGGSQKPRRLSQHIQMQMSCAFQPDASLRQNSAWVSFAPSPSGSHRWCARPQTGLPCVHCAGVATPSLFAKWYGSRKMLGSFTATHQGSLKCSKFSNLGEKSWDFWDFICLVYIYCIFFNILIFTNMSVTSDEKAEHIFPDSTYVWQNARKESFPPCFWLNDSSVEWKMVIYYECWHPGDCAFN